MQKKYRNGIAQKRHMKISSIKSTFSVCLPTRLSAILIESFHLIYLQGSYVVCMNIMHAKNVTSILTFNSFDLKRTSKKQNIKVVGHAYTLGSSLKIKRNSDFNFFL